MVLFSQVARGHVPQTRARLKAKGLLKALGVKDFRPEEAGDGKEAIHSKKHGDLWKDIGSIGDIIDI